MKYAFGLFNSRPALQGPVLLAALAIVGCSSSDPDIRFRTRVVDTFSPVEGAASNFEALVAHSEATPRCETLTNLPPAMRGHTVVSFVYGEPQHQRIAVTLDEEGTPTQYSDGRGDLIASDETVGNATTISLDLSIGQAIAFNHPAGGDIEAMRFPFDEALESEALGRPAAMMARLLTTCGES